MRELLSQKEQRQLKVLEYLFENPDWIYLDDLSKIIGYNARIIKSDIKDLREVFPDFDIRHSTAGIMMVNVQIMVLSESTNIFYRHLIISKF